MGFYVFEKLFGVPTKIIKRLGIKMISKVLSEQVLRNTLQARCRVSHHADRMMVRHLKYLFEPLKYLSSLDPLIPCVTVVALSAASTTACLFIIAISQVTRNPLSGLCPTIYHGPFPASYLYVTFRPLPFNIDSFLELERKWLNGATRSIPSQFSRKYERSALSKMVMSHSTVGGT